MSAQPVENHEHTHSASFRSLVNENLYAFKTNDADEQFSQFFSSNKLNVFSALNPINIIKAELTIMKDPATGEANPANFNWIEKEAIEFRSNSGEQILLVDLITDEFLPGTNTPRFWLHRLDTQGLMHISSVEHRVHGSYIFIPNMKRKDPCTKHASTMAIKFQMNREDATPEFKIDMFIKDGKNLDPNHEHNCDPQVSNAPPT